MVQLEQRSSQWHEWRRTKIGSSEIGTILGVNPFKSPYQLWEEKTGLVEPEDLSNNFNVQRGIMLEPVALELLNDELKSKFNPATFNHELYDFIGYSSDGFDPERMEITEIKCMGAKNHTKVLETKQAIDYYIPQCQWGMMLSNTKICHFVSYNQSEPENYVRVEIKADEKYQQKLLSAAKTFWDLVKTKTPPELMDSDYKNIENNETEMLASLYKQAIEAQEIADKRVDSLKEKIKELANGKRIKFSGIFAAAHKRKGNVDYSKIPGLAAIDVEQYRKPAIDVFKVIIK